MKASFNFSMDLDSMQRWNQNVTATISHIGNYSRKALMAACEEILAESLMQVPIETGTLASGAGYEITGSYKTGWAATIGYGNTINPINPRTGQAVSEYAGFVHEDLYAIHPHGKAKFLEDPVRMYATKYPRTVFKYMKGSLGGA